MGYKVKKNTFPRETKRVEVKINTLGELAVKRGIEYIRSLAVPNIPVRTGRAKGSIQGSAVVEGDAIFSVETKRNFLSHLIIGVLGSNVPYIRRLEFGFSGSDSLGREYDQKGLFFFSKAFTSSKMGVKNIIKNTLKL